MAHTDPTPFRQALFPDLTAPVAARRALERFSAQLKDDVFERSALVISEVVTNSVRHAGLTQDQRIDVEIALLPERLRIEVTDNGDGFEPPATFAPKRDDSPGGWGLALVDQLADRWGIDFSHSTRIWCEFDRSSP
jgi:anti-sigma regulatory factor (Ser/Thr protein kinase)